MRKIVIVIISALVLTAVSVSAFDGNRKGFVLGGGLGFAPVAKWNANPGPDESKAGAGANFMIGYALDEFNLIVAEGNFSSYNSDYGATVYQGFSGACWYHYIQLPGKSFFTTLGLGAYNFDFEISGIGSGSNDPGFGLLGGGGYAFTRHFQVGGYLGWGKTKEPGYAYDHFHLNVLVDVVGF